MIKFLQLSFTILLSFIIFVSGLFAQNNLNKQLPTDLVRHWNFNNSADLTEAAVGTPLTLVGSHVAVDGPSDTSGAARIGVGSHYISQHGISPNSFNTSNSIRSDIILSSIVTLKLFNSLGEFVAELENGKLAGGRYERSFDISNLSSGVYFYKLTANNFSAIGKMNLLK